ncbi:MAG: chromosomal replication initiator protein DnaA [Clostridia bacterium]|nr:chromosomal replication initiator protein DnaA [Clostridia bacterium]
MSQTYLEDMSLIWNMIRDSLHDKLSSETVDLWFADVTVVSFENDTITLATPSDLKCRTINTHHIETIQKRFCQLMGFDVKVEVISTAGQEPRTTHGWTGSFLNEKDKPVAEDRRDDDHLTLAELFRREDEPSVKEEKQEEEPEAQPPRASRMPISQVNYTFDNFIIGASNKFAHAACYAVAESPARSYNPLFIYGDSGLGKTHLMYAIINHLKQNNPDINIIYIKGDEFTNELVDSIRHNDQQKFRDKYRKCDVLLIDDIQFIAGKESTQEEFFHTFNALYENYKQIILTSDRPPREIRTLEDRLKTRFEWGLIADIQPPDLELRVAIIKKKAEEIGIDLPHDLHMFLAENLRKNVRQIEGSINKLSALSMLSGKKLDMDLVNSFISELLGGDEPVQVTVDKIFDAVSEKYGVSKEEIYGTHRTKEIATARHVTIYLLRNLTDMSFPNIGRMFNRDHSTIMNSIDVVERRLRSDSMFVMDIAELKKIVTGQNH